MSRIYELKNDLPKITDMNVFNWECKRDGCWGGPCLTQRDKKPRMCPGYGRPLIGDPVPLWEILHDA